MKLTIRSDIITTLTKLLKQDYGRKFRFSFGKMIRSGFIPYLNYWDYKCIKESLESKYSTTRKRIGNRIQKELCDIGFVTNRRIFLSEVTEEEGENVAITAFHIGGKYDIVLLRTRREYQVEIELIQQPLTLKDMFDPIKFLYGLFNNPIVEIKETKNIIQEYNTLFNKSQDTPWIVPQGLRFLQENQLATMKDYMVMPMRRGKKYMLYLIESGAYLISKTEIFRVEKDVPKSLYNTIVMGDWYENSFTGYDIVSIGNTDVRKRSLVQRIKQLRIVTIRFPFCEVIKCLSGDLGKHTQELLKEYDGVIFAPNRAHYTNDRVFLYQPVENVGIKFKIEERSECGFSSFTLKTGAHSDSFVGTNEFPYESSIPLSCEDRNFIGPLNDTVFEFRWESDGLMPYMRSYEHETSTTKFANQAWNYMNNHLPKELVINSLRIFKKEPTLVKEN
jgi:hypothetical protein